jgi:hypothetical protein
MKREREDAEEQANDLSSEDDFGPRLEDLGPKPTKKPKKKRVKFEKFFLEV